MEQELLEVYRKLENERKKKTAAQKERNKLRNEIQSAKSALEAAKKILSEASGIITKTTQQIQPANTAISRAYNDSNVSIQSRLSSFDTKAEALIQSRLNEINNILESILTSQPIQSSNPSKFQQQTAETKSYDKVVEKQHQQVKFSDDVEEDETDVWKEFEESERKKQNTPHMRPPAAPVVQHAGPSKTTTSISASNLNDLLANYDAKQPPKQPHKEPQRSTSTPPPQNDNWFQQNSSAIIEKLAKVSDKQPTTTNAIRSPPYIPPKLHSPSSVVAPSVIPARDQHTATVIWLHSVGETGEMWKDVVLPHTRNIPWVKMIFPTASVNYISDIGKHATSWWDGLADMEVLPRADERNIEASVLKIILMVNREIMNEIEPDRIILAGVSQGAMIAFRTAYILLSQEIGGVVTMSSRLKPNLDFDLIGGNKVSVPLFATANEDDLHISIQGLKDDIKAMHDGEYKVTSKFYPHHKHLPTAATIGDVMEWIQERLPREFEKKGSNIKWL